MTTRRFFLLSLLSLFTLVGVLSVGAQEQGQVVTPQGVYDSLVEALAQAEDGDTIEVYGGVYEGPIIVDRSVSLIGYDWPVIDGGGRGNVVKVIAPDVVLRGFVIRDSGDSLMEENAGLAVEASNVIVEDNRLEETLFGIYLREANSSVVRNNLISSKDLDVPRRGDPVRVWYSNDVTVEGNHINKGRDVVLWYSENLTVKDNEVSEGRYGLHFMYCDDAIIENNLLINNSVGTFLMYSRRLHLFNNTIAGNRGPSGFGVGLKDMDDAIIKDNLFVDNRVGAHLDNSPREINSIGLFEGNVFAYNDIGVNLMPSVRQNHFVGNSFIDNQQQVAIAGGNGGRFLENLWTIPDDQISTPSITRGGNYWSDYVGYDGDKNGQGDVPYKAERLFEDLMDQNSTLRLFMYSPVEQAINFAARAVPFVKPQPKLTDDLPLMAPVVPAGLPIAGGSNADPMWIASLLLLLGAVVLLLLGSGKRANVLHWPWSK